MALGSTQQRVKLRLLVVVVLVVVVVWWWWLAMAAGLGDNGQLTSISLWFRCIKNSVSMESKVFDPFHRLSPIIYD